MAWVDSVYAGHKTVSGELIIATKGGFRKTRTMRRNPEEHRWKAEHPDCFVQFPWEVDDKTDEAEFVIEDHTPPVPTFRPPLYQTYQTLQSDRTHHVECMLKWPTYKIMFSLSVARTVGPLSTMAPVLDTMTPAETELQD